MSREWSTIAPPAVQRPYEASLTQKPADRGATWRTFSCPAGDMYTSAAAARS